MDNRRNSGSFSARAVNPALPPPPADNHAQKRASYRRPVEAQPTVISSGSPISPPEPTMSNAIASNTARPVASASSNRQRRRHSQHIPPPTTGAMSESVPAAPEVPRAPPSSYRDPYAKGVRVPARTASGRSRDPAIQLNPSRQQATIQTAADRLYELRSPPYAPVEPLAGTVERRGSSRKPSVPDRSPLQKLEGKLDDISKEERRARILEAELAAQEKAEAEMRARRAREAAIKEQQEAALKRQQEAAALKQQQEEQRAAANAASVPERSPRVPSEASSGNNRVSMRTPALHLSPQMSELESDDGYVYDLNEPWDPNGARAVAVQPIQAGTVHKRPPVPSGYDAFPHNDAASPQSTSTKGKEPVGVARGSGSYSDRSAMANIHKKPVPAAAGLGLVGVDDASAGAELARSDSKREYGRRDSRGIMAAQMDMQQHSIDYKGTPRSVENRQLKPLKPLMPPVPQTNRKSVVFSESESELEAHDPEKTRKRDSRHSRHSSRSDPERTYTPGPMLDEWRNAPVGTLGADDLDLNTPVTANSGNKAWWEESKAARRRRSSSHTSPTYDGYADTPTPTAFNPPLYLKCGPLLRYTGLRKDRSRPGPGNEREIWRGSVMIVTVDASSSYVKPPTLRLFKQPMDILPPPPEEVDQDQLDPSYIDPVEGQIKVSRTGKTLYVKPIDEIPEDEDLSRIEDDTGLFSQTRSTSNGSTAKSTRIHKRDGEKLGKVRDFPGIRLYAERGVTFWRFNIEVELGTSQTRIAYRINQGPAIGFWVPAKGESMNIMFHSCNGFSMSVESKQFCGPDPMWRDVLNTHQTRPFHVMIGGGDQIYNDAAMRQTTLFRSWTESRNPLHKHHQPFSEEMQNELEQFYLDRYSMWFSQGLFGMANSQIPMVNMWDDHDIIDGYGSYPHHFMQTPVFTGVGAVAFKYYMLFQHQSVAAETEKTEPSWLLGKSPGPYIKERSRSVFMQLGRQVAFLGLDCRTERRRDEILTEDSYDIIFDRLEDEIIKGETKHLIVLLGVPIAYPRLNFLEILLTSRIMDPIKALGRTGLLGNFVNKFDGGVEILDDLDDHWTAKHHKEERNWFIRELQHIASTKSVRVTILGGDVHLAAVGQFYTNKKLNVPKDRDHRYMPNVVSSAIVNTPPPDIMADIINKRNKIHHLDQYTDEDMIPLFSHGVDGKKRNNNHLLPHRNWCSIREYKPGSTPPDTPSPPSTPTDGPRLGRTMSDFAPGQLVRRLSGQQTRPSARGRGPPVSYRNNPAYAAADNQQVGHHHQPQSSFSPDRSDSERPTRSRRNSLSSLFRRRPSADGGRPGTAGSMSSPRSRPSVSQDRPSGFHRRPSVISKKGAPKHDEFINLEGGLDICLNVEVSQHDPAGITMPYRLLVPALHYVESEDGVIEKEPRKPKGFFAAFGAKHKSTIGDDGNSISGSESGSELGEVSSEDEEQRARQRYTVGPRILIPAAGAQSRRDSASAPAPRENNLTSGFHANSAAKSGSTPTVGAPRNLAPEIHGRRSLDVGAGTSSRASAWENAAAKRHASAPQHPPVTQPAAQTTTIPSRSNSARKQPSYNSSHKSQLPSPEVDIQVNKKSKRQSYPPHPAIVGAGPGSPYAKYGQGLQPRQDTTGGDYFSSGGRDGQPHPAVVHPATTAAVHPAAVHPAAVHPATAPRQAVDPEYNEKPVQRADYAQPQRSGYDRTAAAYPAYPQRNGSVGAGARYLGADRYQDGEDSSDSPGDEDDDEDGRSFGGKEQQDSQDSFVVPKRKKKWQIWK